MTSPGLEKRALLGNQVKPRLANAGLGVRGCRDSGDDGLTNVSGEACHQAVCPRYDPRRVPGQIAPASIASDRSEKRPLRSSGDGHGQLIGTRI